MERKNRPRSIDSRLFRIRVLKAEVVNLHRLLEKKEDFNERLEIVYLIQDKLVEIDNFVTNGGFGYL